ncbi:hypothetical protein DL93DRAFT_2205473 [Clavulina sp. PMI_390]|nr:hypothetical protein DL93DRAFT_2205473 [Clavulina sp. PMI_390]
MAPPPVPERTPCNTLAEWNQRVSDAMLIIDQPETEENWDRMERAFLVLASVVRGGAYKLEDDFIPGVKTLGRATTSAMLSDRSKLSGMAIEFLTTVGVRMAAKFEPLVHLYIPAVLKLCARSGKIYVSRATNCLKIFAACCRVPPLVTLMKEYVTDKSQTLRFAVVDALHELLSTSIRDGLPRRGRWVEDVEFIIKATATDANPETRKMSRKAFASYAELWPDRVSE